MLSLTMAQQLKKAGLEWHPQLHDTFGMPDRGMDDRQFVITEVMAYIEILWGSPMVTFHGTAEWALDYVLQTEAVWIPSETQLREMLQRYSTKLVLRQTDSGYECSLAYQGQPFNFVADEGCNVYASALLHLLWLQAADPETN